MSRFEATLLVLIGTFIGVAYALWVAPDVYQPLMRFTP
jgi:hypothetical protein